MAPASAANSAPAVDMTAFLASLQPENRHIFLEPSASIPGDSLNIVKDTLEAFAAQVGDLQQERLKESRKRKRGGEKVVDDVLKLRKVYADGFETAQVWQQAKRIIGGVLKFSGDVLDELEENEEVVALGSQSESEGEGEGGVRSLTFGEDGFEVDSEDGSEDEVGEEGEDEDEEEDEEEEEVGDEDEDEEVAFDDAPEEDDEDEEEEDDAEEYVEDPNGLNDGFFSIDDFNKQTQWFEDQDARGDPNTDQASDDEDVDWGADPLAPPKPGSKPSKKHTDDEPLEDEDSDEDDGPTFGDMALDAPEGASDDEAMDIEDGVDDDEANDFNANEVYYKDFFAPPSRKNKAGKPFKKKEARFEVQQPNEEDMERAMADVKRDLFDDESENEDSEDALSDVSAGDPKSRRSAHERRQAKLAEEIRKLEAASVAKREWTLSGEASAASRPVNSLLEEDMDFEHVGKPVPVITPEISESIEDLIKRRILCQEFDEVLRRRPDTDSVPANTRRGLIELDDSKPNKSLAEVYEEEHVKNTNPDTYVSKSDEKLQKEEKEVEALWKDVSARLDALSSWHYKPKPAAPQLSVVSDIATVAMEDAQPTTAQGVTGESSRMAPQEVYKAGADKDSVAKGEVVTRAGLPIARQEMSREDRTRRRRRHKERVRKAGGADAQNDKKLGTRAKMQRDTMAELKKGGVKVINRKGEITDVDGNKAKAKKAVTSGSFKL
ncbi:U3 small nucleolar ribonucleoprotein mpp10 [Pochonia chlamydosporia 170]|uniref:U3 small nucleolar ribonucleoprotein protein MPP10 n=1 Tax=Pochonia chlamydosporia 170 TaxID=1380566 RepID=A0A179FJS6_METCM|nr:U3 small nucleolar ribonucleoprotein mpp10 [Pochonia chlamydosporia 170]OAQ65794.1 U3 small nucleolar ribonucleoprotein mpp10 [Pochonia chlamydosporia 170]